MDVRERVGWTVKTNNKYCWQRDEQSSNECCGPAVPALERSVPLTVLPCRGPGEASAPGWACDSLAVVFLIHYPCHCVKWWKEAGGVGRRVQREEMLFLLFLINNVAIIPYSIPPPAPPLHILGVACPEVVVWWKGAAWHHGLVPCSPATLPVGTTRLGHGRLQLHSPVWPASAFRNENRTKTRNETS